MRLLQKLYGEGVAFNAGWRAADALIKRFSNEKFEGPHWDEYRAKLNEKIVQLPRSESKDN